MTISSFRHRQAAIFDDPAGAGLAVLAGIAVPLAAFGKAVMAVPLVPAALLALILIFRQEARVRLLRLALSPEGVALGLFFLFALVSALLSDHSAKALFTLARSAVFVCVAAAISVALADQTQRATLACKALLAGSGVAFLYVCVTIYVDDTVYVWLTGGGESSDRAVFKAFGSSSVCLVPVLLWAGNRVGIRAWQFIPAVGALVILLLWHDGYQPSAAGLLGITTATILVGFVVLVGRLRKPYRIAAVVVSLLAGLSVVVFVTVSLPSPSDIQRKQFVLPTQLVDAHRQVIWSFTTQAIQQRPILGYGPNTINRIEGADRTSPIIDGDYIPSHPHSWIYELASETGLLGLSTFCVALLLVLRRTAILALDGALAGWAGVALFAAFWGSSLVNFSIWAAWWQLTFLVLFAIVVAGATDEKPARTA